MIHTFSRRDLRSIPFLFMLSGLLLLSGCRKDGEPPMSMPPNTGLDDNKITISNIEGIPANVSFNKIAVELYGTDWEIIGGATASYHEGKAVLTLPNVFSEQSLMKAVRSNASDYTGCWPAVTDNPDARVAGLRDIFAYNNEERVGRIYLSNWSGKGAMSSKVFIKYHYADSPYTLSGYNFTIKPSTQKSYKYEISFERGWNAYAEIKPPIGVSLCTTSIPEETELKWYFQSLVY